jgi:hypothetical protein
MADSKRLPTSSSVLEVDPSSVILAAGDALFDKVHPFDTIMHVGINRVDLLSRFTLAA